MTLYSFTMTVEVFDEDLMLKRAKEHAVRSGIEENEIQTPIQALIMLLDPGSGGSAWDGPLQEIGIDIEDSQVDILTEAS
ncbi:hypothetical protein [Mesorhizobium sp. CN2-181]|uniref:hypothetical protein n=1 Tax=Mesorhizobium yinganensis TaxID=3157707 RepID=UPI0032B8591F